MFSLESWKEVVAHVKGDEVGHVLVCNSMVYLVVVELHSGIGVCSSVLARFDTGLVKGLVSENFKGDVMA